MKTILIDGNMLTIESLVAISSDEGIRVSISGATLARVQRSKDFLDEKNGGDKIIYGVNTGFGPMASHIIGRDWLEVLQKNLITGHAVGAGSPIDKKYVLAAMAVRLNTLVKGYSGISVGLIKRLARFINLRIIPVVPEHGAVGASGDLVQLAHIASALIGEGDVFYRGRKRSARDVSKESFLGRYKLEPKEGLALINGTAVMSGITALLCSDADRLLGLSVRFGALALELVNGFTDSLSAKAHSLRPHTGQIAIAKAMRKILETSALVRDRSDLKEKAGSDEAVHEISEEVQQIYSLRCTPQILGPILDIICGVKRCVETEINSVSDNPIVDWEAEKFIHGGNFHGDYIAAAADQLKIGLVKLTLFSERRSNFFLDRKMNKIFPPFMNLAKPGLNVGLQGLQFVATSTAAQSQTYAFPHSIHSITTNGGNQDVVSMGTDAALIAAKVVENAFIVLAVELITLCQGVDYLGIEKKLSASSQLLYGELRRVFPAIRQDRELTGSLSVVIKLIKQNPSFSIEW